jgi:hypothetical protein
MSVPFRARPKHRSIFSTPRLAAAVSGLAAVSASGEASAQSVGTNNDQYGAGMLYVTYAFGAAQGFGIGVEARTGVLEKPVLNCENDEDVGNHPFGGGALRFEWYPSSHSRLLIVAQGGYYFGTTTSTHGELGAGYRWGEDGGFDTVLGAELDISLAALALHFDPTRLELAPAAGLVIPPVGVFSTGSCWIAGRPRRDSDGIAPLPKLALNARSRSEAPPQAVHVWSTRARTEWASVPAFRELADQLRAVNAPASLVTRCYGAYADEVRHAMLSGGHCAELGEGRVVLDRNAVSTRAPLTGRAGLTRLAVESWVDGCLGEGTAAACAEREAELAQHGGIRATQRTIARDEGQHAELGWDVLQWALEEGGDDVRSALHAAALARTAEPAAQASDAALDAYGIVSHEEHEAIAAQHRQRCLTRLDRVLAA